MSQMLSVSPIFKTDMDHHYMYDVYEHYT